MRLPSRSTRPVVRLLSCALFRSILLAAAAPGPAAERSYRCGCFDRVRVSGTFEVRLTVGGSPRARAEGGRELIDQVEVRVDGNTLVVAMGTNGWGERGATAASVQIGRAHV